MLVLGANDTLAEPVKCECDQETMAEDIDLAADRAGDQKQLGPGRETSRPRRTIQSVDRALFILDVLANADGELALGDISRQAGLNISTCHHLLSTLAAHGYVGQNPKGRSYYLGNRILELSTIRTRQFDLVEFAMPELRQLNLATMESVHLATMQGYDLVTLTMLESRLPVGVAITTPGKTNAAHATATGKAILAWLPEPEIARIIAEKGLTPFTEATIVDVDQLIEELRHVRRNGYAVDKEEFQKDVVCIGSAIRDHKGAVIGSISCSVPKMRARTAYLDDIKAGVRQSAVAISERLGGPSEVCL